MRIRIVKRRYQLGTWPYKGYANLSTINLREMALTIVRLLDVPWYLRLSKGTLAEVRNAETKDKTSWSRLMFSTFSINLLCKIKLPLDVVQICYGFALDKLPFLLKESTKCSTELYQDSTQIQSQKMILPHFYLWRMCKYKLLKLSRIQTSVWTLNASSPGQFFQ